MHTDFFLELSEYHISVREFFSTDLLKLLNRNFGLKNVLISYFDTKGNFLSWVTPEGLVVDNPNHPYRKFVSGDVIRYNIYQDAVRDRLTYFDIIPRLYKSTDMISPIDYEHAAYTRFLEENFQAHYSVTMAFGINAYIQVAFFKSVEEGDFTEDEVAELLKIYVYVADAYKNFKKYEQRKIVSEIQSKIIESGEKAYLVLDDFRHVMLCNDVARTYLKNIFGPIISEEMDNEGISNCMYFLVGQSIEQAEEGKSVTCEFQNYVFDMYVYDQTYSNKIIDRYYWVTIRKKEDTGNGEYQMADTCLTHTEQRIAALLCKGLTYKVIADEMVVSYHTVKKHVQNIYAKCGINNRYQLREWLAQEQQKK